MTRDSTYTHCMLGCRLYEDVKRSRKVKNSVCQEMEKC